MRSGEDLRALLRRIDGRGYKAYKELRGRFQLGPVELLVDHVQGDPFAAPSRMRLRVEQATARWPDWLITTRVRQVAFEDWLARNVRRVMREAVRGQRGSGRSGRVSIDAGGQAVLERSAASASPAFVEARIEVGLPAAGRRVLGREAEALLLDELVALAQGALLAETCELESVRSHVETAENHAALQQQLAERGLVAFVPDGAVLPRETGASDRPLPDAVPFEAPESLRVTLELPNAPGRIGGLGIAEGVTLIVGGGYHGKSTLLRAIERGVHPHIPGDGRERVATVPSAVKIRAEDGRRVVGCDISAFIGDLPGGRTTRSFDSEDASGSTSQAANIIEAIEASARALLLDEDSSATNFMGRDARMQQLVRSELEPITPFVDRVRELADLQGVSTVLVMGGCGDYFEVADTVIEMRAYAAHDVTAEARRIARESGRTRSCEARGVLAPAAPRIPRAASLDPSRGRRDVKIDVRGLDELGFGTETIDLRGVEQLVDPSQLRAIGYALVLAADRFMGEGVTIPALLDALDRFIDDEGIEALDRPGSDLARPRRLEIAAALARLRSLEVDRDQRDKVVKSEDPMETKAAGKVKDAVQERFGAVAENYATSVAHKQGPDLDALVARAVESGASEALDVACGTGHTALALAERGISVVAFDLTDAMLDQGRVLAAERGLENVRFERADAESLPRPDDSSALVVSRLAAHHFPRPRRAVAEWARVCRPDGRILFVDVLGPADPVADTFLQTIELLRDHSHVRDFRSDEWLGFMEDAGLEAALLETWPLVQGFDAWVERMATPAPNVEVLRRLFGQAPREARDALDLHAGEATTFTLTLGLFEARPRA